MEKKKWLIYGLGGFLVGVGALATVNLVTAKTNEMEFCISCHSMQINFEEYKETVHYRNASGVRATCADCHVPKEFFPKMKAKILAVKDVYHEFIGDFAVPDEIKNDPEAYREHYEKYRWRMAQAVWAKMKASDSATCRSCHQFEAMDFDEQSRSARRKHPVAMEKGKTCIDCHKGIAHEEPDEPDDEDTVALKH